jgi:hypothetical protein
MPCYLVPMTITVSVPEELARQAQSVGLSVEAYVEALAARALHGETLPAEDDRRRAVEGLLAFRHTHHLTLHRDRLLGLRAWLHQDHKR